MRIGAVTFLAFGAFSTLTFRAHAQKTDPEFTQATQVLARFQWHLLHEQTQEAAALITPQEAIAQAQPTPTSPYPCSFWSDAVGSELKKSRRDYQGTSGLKKLTEELARSTIWFRAESQIVTFHSTHRAFFFNPKQDRLTHVQCEPLTADDETLKTTLLTTKVTPQIQEHSKAWEKNRQRFAFYSFLMPSLYSRVYALMLSQKDRDAVSQWAPLAKLTGAWLQDASTPNRSIHEKNVQEGLHPVDRDLQRRARAVLEQLNALRPDLSGDEKQFLKKFTFSKLFALGAQVFHYADLVSLWHARLQGEPSKHDFDSFLSENKSDLLQCCFSESDFKKAPEFIFKKISTPLPVPPPL